jgi:hypothetical protein
MNKALRLTNINDQDYDSQHNDVQHNDVQHNDVQHTDIQHISKQQSVIRHNNTHNNPEMFF